MSARVTDLFRLDLRALAALRIGVGLLVLLDLALRARDLTAFYTDQGALPRITLLQIPHPTYLSLYMAAGSVLGVGFLMLLTAAAALGLTLGWHPRWCALATWLLHIALKHRNPLVLDVGDLELGLALFWLVFLPCGARFSLRPRPELADRWASVATFGYQLQIGLIYLMGFLNKSGPEWRENGLALYYCLSYDKFATPLGRQLLSQPELLRTLTSVVLYAELAIFVLLWIPYARALACLLIALLHLGIVLTMSLGLIPLISVVVTLGLWPLPRPRAGEPAPRLARPTQALLALNCLYIVHLNWALAHPDVVVPMPIKLWGYFLRQQQDWTMFAPSPGTDDGRYEARGELVDGQTVALLPAEPPNQRWRCWLHNLSSRNDPRVNESFAAYLAGAWNEGHPGPERVRRVQLVYLSEPTPLPGQPLVTTPISLYDYACPPPPNEVIIP